MNKINFRTLRLTVLAIAVLLAFLMQGPSTGLQILKTAAYYIIVLSFIVFVHEFGHYIVAKWAGVRILTFSIGFGRELVGWNDTSGTRWKLSLIPFGGYVKMFGDASEASNPSSEVHNYSVEEQQYTFHHKQLYQKAAIVAAGPVFNFLLAIVILTGLAWGYGINSTLPIAETVQKGSAAEAAGIKPGDRIVSIDGKETAVFNDIIVSILTNLGTPVKVQIERNGKVSDLVVTPKVTPVKDVLGDDATQAIIGITNSTITHQQVGLVTAVGFAVKQTYNACANTLTAVGQMLIGKRNASTNIKGPIKMAKMVGKTADMGLITMLSFIAAISANLGLINLFPIPVLDGGHLLIYAIQALTRRPLNEKVQEYGFRVGLSLISMLMAFAIINDFWPGIFR